MKTLNFKLKINASGEDIAGGARKKLEKRLGRSIVSKENYLPKSFARRIKKEKKAKATAYKG